MLSKVLTGSLAAAATVSLGMAGTVAAQAHTVAPHARVPLTASPSTVPAGLNTAVTLTNPCPSGTKPSSVTGFPAPNGTTTNLQAVTAKAPTKAKLAGVWPAGGGPFSVKVSCPGGQSNTSTVTVESAPAASDVTGVGSDTIQSVMDQFSADYNNSHSSGHLYSWDATNPVTGAIGDNITTKQGCTAIPRPNGSSAGITALETENGTTGGHPCIDFARSSRARSGDPNTVTFDTLAGDAVTYATQPGTHAPNNLTTAQLQGIYNCTITNWSSVGGTAGTIAAFIPQSGSGTRSFFLTAIGLASPGPCVSTSATVGGAAGASANTLEENEGVAPSLNGAAGSGVTKADVIFPFSVGKYIAERYHSASCGGVSGCYPTAVCTPTATQNLFGCDKHGTMVLDKINGTNPTTPYPLTNTSKGAVINAGFTSTFQRFLYEVVVSTQPSLPSYLVPYFGSTGFVCTNSTAKKDLKNYGFLVLPAGAAAGDCGSLS
jgi:ABC-type phosphate transport system substrate-binding protein